MSDFTDIMETANGEIAEPKDPPEGVWTLQVVSGKVKKNTYENGPVVDCVFTLRALEAGPDVADFELDGVNIEDLSPVFYRIPIWDKKSWWNVNRFADKIGLDLPEDVDYPTLVEAFKGEALKAELTIDHKEGYDPRTVVGSIAAA